VSYLLIPSSLLVPLMLKTHIVKHYFRCIIQHSSYILIFCNHSNWQYAWHFIAKEIDSTPDILSFWTQEYLEENQWGGWLYCLKKHLNCVVATEECQITKTVYNFFSYCFNLNKLSFSINVFCVFVSIPILVAMTRLRLWEGHTFWID